MTQERLKVRPNGFYVLVKMQEVEKVSAGGIITSVGNNDHEQDACDVGEVLAIGPTAFAGFPGCDPKDYSPGHPFHNLQPYEIWGIKVGDKVEYRRHEGKVSTKDKLYRSIPDSMIINTIVED